MPRVPVYERSETLRPIHQQGFSVSATADQMGAGIGLGMTALAAGMKDAGKALHDGIVAKAQADRAMIEFRQSEQKTKYDDETGLLKQTGEKAIGSRAAYERKMTADRDRIAKNLSSAARKFFEPQALDTMTNSLQELIPHEFRQIKSLVNETSASKVMSLVAEGASAFASPGGLPRLAGMIGREIMENFRLNGRSEAEIAQETAARISQLNTTAIMAQARIDPLAAQQQVEAVSEQLTPQDREHVTAQLAGPVLNARAEAIGREIMSQRRGMPQGQPASAEHAPSRTTIATPQDKLRQRVARPGRRDLVATLDESFTGNVVAFIDDAPHDMQGRLGLLTINSGKGGSPATVDLSWDGRPLGLAPRRVRDYVIATASRYNLSFPAPGREWPDAAGPGALRPVEFGTRLAARGSGLSQRATLPSTAEIEARLAGIDEPALRDRARSLVLDSIEAETRNAQERDEAATRDGFRRLDEGATPRQVADALALDGSEAAGRIPFGSSAARSGRREAESDPFLLSSLIGLAARSPDAFSGLSLPDHFPHLSRRDRDGLERLQQAVMANEPEARDVLAGWSVMSDTAEEQLGRMGLMPEHTASLEAGRTRSGEIARLNGRFLELVQQRQVRGEATDPRELRQLALREIAPIVMAAMKPRAAEIPTSFPASPASRLLVAAQPISSERVVSRTATSQADDSGSAPGETEERRRRRSIIENTPYRIKITTGQPEGVMVPVYRWHDYGVNRLNEVQASIAKYSSEYGVDEDIVKAIFYYENSQGYYDAPLDWVGMNSSIRPGNINPDLWGELVPGRTIRGDADANVEASVKLIARIVERLEDPTIEKIATLYNGLSLEEVNQYGWRVKDIYDRRLWERLSGDYGEPSQTRR